MTFCFGHWLSGQATSDPTWQAEVAKLRPIQKVTGKIQPGPIHCFTWAEPNNSAFLFHKLRSVFLGLSLSMVHFFFGSHLFFFWASAFFQSVSLIFSLSYEYYLVNGLSDAKYY